MGVETGVQGAVETGVETCGKTDVKNEGEKKEHVCARGVAPGKKKSAEKTELFFWGPRFSHRFPPGFPHPISHQFPRVFRTQKSPGDVVIQYPKSMQ